MTTDSPTKGRGVTFEDVRLPPWMTGLIGGVALVIVWWIVGLAWVTPTGLRPIPTPLEVVVTIAQMVGVKVDYPEKMLRRPKAWLNHVTAMNPQLGAAQID